MKNFKKVVAGLLAVLMLALSVNVSFAAEEYSAKEEIVVAKVNAAGIMTGTDKGFEPSKSLTRAEAAAIIVRMKGISESAVKAMAGTTLFTDVSASHWASGYVNQASNLGIVKGVSATQFAPDREVTVAEFTTMAVRALGAGQLVDSEGTWPTNYVNFANENDILKDVTAIYTATATRMNAATIVANTLEAVMWDKTGVKSNGEIEWTKNDDGKTILSEVLKIKKFDGTKAIEVKSASNKDHTVTYNDGSADGADLTTVDALDLTGIKTGLIYDYWKNEDGKVIGIWESEKNDADKVEFTAIAGVTKSTSPDAITKVKLTIDGKDKEYKVADGFTATLNEVNKTTTLAKNPNAFGTAYIVGGKVKSIYAEQYETMAVVKEVKTKSVVFESFTDAKTKSVLTTDNKITIDNDKYDYFFTKDGKSIKVEDLEEGDVIAFYSISNKKYVGEVIEAEVKGEVSAKSSSKNTVRIDGTTYDVANATMFGYIKLDEEIEAYTTKDGKIALIKVVEEAAGNVAIVKSIRPISDKYSAGTNNALEVVLYYSDSTESEVLDVDLDETIEDLGIEKAIGAVTLTTDDFVNGSAATAGASTEVLYAGQTHNYWTTKVAAIADLYPRGAACCYEVNGDELTFKKLSSNAEYTSVAAKELTIKSKAAYIENVEVDENTKFFRVKNDSKKDYLISVEELDFEDLDTIESLGDGSYVADLTYDDTTATYAGIVIIGNGTTINRVSDTNLIFVTDKSQGSNKRTIDGYTLDGELVSFEADKDDDAYDSFDSVVIGTVYDFVVKNDKVTKIDPLTNNTAGYQDDELKDEIDLDYTTGDSWKDAALRITDYNTKKTSVKFGPDRVAFADKMLVLKYNQEDAEYSVKSVDDLEEFITEEDNAVVVDYVTYTSDDDTEVVAVVYMTLKAN